MFTGIVKALGKLVAKQALGNDVRIRIGHSTLDTSGLVIGDSIAVNGICLTVVEWTEQGFTADVSLETIRRTTLGTLSIGDRVNLEAALTLGQSMGGHWVSGHVDGLAQIITRTEEARSIQFKIQAPGALKHYIAAKGSVTLDGISLTVNEVQDVVFTVNLVPHTQHVTNANTWVPGRQLNLEVDIIARYLERLVSAKDTHSSTDSDPINLELLTRSGFTN